MRNHWLRDALIGGACLMAGVVLAAVLSRSPFSGDGAAVAGKSKSVVGGGRTAGGKVAGVSKTTEVSAGKVADVNEFSVRWSNLDGTQAKVEALIVWLNTFEAADFETLMNQLLAVYGEEDLTGVSEGAQELLEWMFDDNESVGVLMFARWTEVSPDSAIAMLQNLQPEISGEISSYVLPYLWASDPELGAETMAELKARNPEAFEDNFDEDVFGEQLYMMSEAVAVRWMIDYAEDETDVEFLFDLGVNDGEAVMNELMRLKDASDREEVLQLFLEAYGTQDPSAAKALLAENRDAFEDEELFDETTEELQWLWVMEDPAARLDPAAPEVAARIFQTWLDDDPEAGLAWVLGEGAGVLPEEKVAELIGNRVDGVPFDVVMEHGKLDASGMSSSWVRTLSDEQFEQAIGKFPAHAVTELFRRDPDRAVVLAASTEVGTPNGLLAQLVANDATRRDGWFDRVPEAHRASVAPVFFSAWAEADPAEAFAAATAAESVEGGTAVLNQWLRYEDVEVIYAAAAEHVAESDASAREVAKAWAQRDPQTAGETFLADGIVAAVPPLIEEWLKRDSVAASNFIREQLEPGDTRDAAVVALVRGIVGQDAEAAREWAATISEVGLRDQLIRGLDGAN
ncbi:MAG: hypothetical protein ACI9NC_001518 [Verrucomicrobiales bacterium]|jgi:hypothetical protein